MLDLARGALKLKRDDLQAALDGDLSARHLFVLKHIHAHTLSLQRELADIDTYLLAAMQPLLIGARPAAAFMLGGEELSSCLVRPLCG